jgi:hypothetical protein
MSGRTLKPLSIRMSDQLGVIGSAGDLVGLAIWTVRHVEHVELKHARGFLRPLLVSFIDRGSTT